MAFKLPRFDRSIPIVYDNKTPTLPFQQWWDMALKKIEAAIVGIQDALTAAGIALDAAAAAEAAAATAQTAADSVTATAKLSSSGVSGCTITGTDVGTDVTVAISSHTRLYGDGTSVAVTGGNVTGLLYSTLYYIYYDDPAFAGGAVTYQATTSDATAAQTGNRHLVGSVLTPAAGSPPEGGKLVKPPGVGGIDAA